MPSRAELTPLTPLETSKRFEARTNAFWSYATALVVEYVGIAYTVQGGEGVSAPIRVGLMALGGISFIGGTLKYRNTAGHMYEVAGNRAEAHAAVELERTIDPYQGELYPGFEEDEPPTPLPERHLHAVPYTEAA